MQLPFVLQSAEVMKAAVGYLEPHMEKTDDAGKGTIVLATVKGDVHDIGKNLVDIILSNNGYTVVNLGIKQPISSILDAANEHRADAIGMSGLLVKSTVIMKENLEEMNARDVAKKWPVLLGGAALTRGYHSYMQNASGWENEEPPESTGVGLKPWHMPKTEAASAMPATRSKGCGSWTRSWR